MYYEGQKSRIDKKKRKDKKVVGIMEKILLGLQIIIALAKLYLLFM